MQNKASCVLWGGCEALFTPHPLAPFHDISRRIVGDFPEADLEAHNRHEVFNPALDHLARLPVPSVLVFEDAHGPTTLRRTWSNFSAGGWQRLGVMLVLSYRDDEVSEKHPLRSVIGDLPPASLCRVRLQPLSEGAVGCWPWRPADRRRAA